MYKEVMKFKNEDTLVEAHIADLHFGAIEPEKEYQILKEQFLIPLSEMNILDIVSINGDIFDHKFMANSDAIVYALKFMNELAYICKRKNSSLIIISGTASHDADQLKLFTSLLDYGIDLRLIFEIQFIYVKGKRILCIPEAYNKNFELYSTFLFQSGLYDSCYMHGTFVGSIIGKDERDLNEISVREPIFDIDCFCCCLGPIISGHIHTFNRYKNKFYYCGSPIRWKFGEEDEKGFLILIHNYKLRRYFIHFEPIKSFRYDTINLDSMLNSDPKDIIDYINNLKNSGIDNIRVEFTNNDKDKIAILKDFFKNSRSVVIKTDHKKIEIEKKLEDMNNKYNDYDYIFSDISAEEKFVRYVNQQTKSDYWTLDLFKEFLERIEKI